MSEYKCPDKCNVYIDASGDTGFKFGGGSTPTFTIALLVEHESNAAFNRELVLRAKKLAGRQPEQELKYVSLKRHKKKFDALGELGQLRASLGIVSVVKSDLDGPQDGRALNVALQGFSIRLALRHVIESLGIDHAEVWVDACNEDLDRAVQSIVSEGNSAEGDWRLARMISNVHFVNSKSLQMIQAADVFVEHQRSL